MKITEPVTILSDLHIGHSAGLVNDPEQLAPVFAESSTVILNGDSVEMLWKHNRDQARAQLRRLGSVCKREGARAIFVNGNHDPFVSAINHLDLLDGRMLVTHGDILFHEVAPWSREAPIIGPQRERFLEAVGDDDALTDFERQLLAAKWASLALEMREPCAPTGLFPRVRMLLRETLPPWRVLRIVKFWMETPSRAAGLAAMFRPEAKVVVIGHTHYPGVWKRDGRIVINTGAYLPFSTRLAVQIEDGRIVVRQVVRRGKDFALGRTRREIDLGPARVEEERSPSDRDDAADVQFPVGR